MIILINWNRCKRCGGHTRTEKEKKAGYCCKCSKVLSKRKRYKSMMEGRR
nr:MAG TPA: Trm112p-like protein [Caudoviricetes sp.]